MCKKRERERAKETEREREDDERERERARETVTTNATRTFKLSAKAYDEHVLISNNFPKLIPFKWCMYKQRWGIN